MWIRLQPKIMADYLERQFSNGTYRLTFDDIALGIFRIKVPKKEHIEALRYAWQAAQLRLRRIDVCAILVSEVYFDQYAHREPKGEEAIKMCIAGYGGRKAFGIRLLTAKGSRNDPMALVYFHQRSKNVRGQVSAVLDRATVEWAHGRLTKPRARMLVDNVTEPALPEHSAEFNRLMED